MRVYDLQASDYREDCRNQDLLDVKDRWESEGFKQQNQSSA